MSVLVFGLWFACVCWLGSSSSSSSSFVLYYDKYDDDDDDDYRAMVSNV